VSKMAIHCHFNKPEMAMNCATARGRRARLAQVMVQVRSRSLRLAGRGCRRAISGDLYRVWGNIAPE
jgi:hypothetical protein